MCGILGSVPATKKDIFKKSLNLLNHRGPDDEGSFIDNKSGIGLAHRRLSIIDLSKYGNQPMRSSCGRYIIVFNGEIYIYLELRDNLHKRGIVLNTSSDTEILLHYFRIFYH